MQVGCRQRMLLQPPARESQDERVWRGGELNVGKRRGTSAAVQEHGKDHIVEVTVIGTATAKFASPGMKQPRSLAILSLDPQRRQAARVRLGG